MKNIDYEKIGININECRKRKKISQEELAGMVSISRNYVQKIEGGRAHLSLKVIIRISDVLKVPVGVLLGESNSEYFTSYEEVFDVLNKSSVVEYDIISRAVKDLLVNLKRFDFE